MKTSNTAEHGLLKTGQEMVMTKWIGISGTAQIASLKEKELKEVYSSQFVQGAKNLTQHISIERETKALEECHVSLVYNLSTGGIFGGLWEVAAASKVGLEIELDKISMKQETVEICEYFNLNPYYLMSEGSLLIASDRGSDIVSVLNRIDVPAVVIGKITEGNERIIIREEERRFLIPPKKDELVKVL